MVKSYNRLLAAFFMTQCSTSTVCNTGDVRLVEGTGVLNGRVEVCYNNVWGTVCDNMWNNLDAQVVCRMLGYSGMIIEAMISISFEPMFIGGNALLNAYYGQGSGAPLLDRVNCIGNETSLLACPSSGLSIASCTHAHDASVQCIGTASSN